AELLGNIDVDDQLEGGRLLHWQVARPRALENFVYVGRGAALDVGHIRAVGQKRPDLHQPTRHADEDESILQTSIPDPMPLQRNEPGADDDEGLGPLPS